MDFHVKYFAASIIVAIVGECQSHMLFPHAKFPTPKEIVHRESGYSYKTYYYMQTLDHFSFLAEDKTFNQRFLVNDEHWKPGGPIFFYTGNEGDITWFCNNTGFMWDIAPEYNAMLVFAEHRYYGESLPFGNASYKDARHLGYLSSGQALADFAILINHIKNVFPNTDKSPVISFGGSYGGMLSAWFRMKYPSSVIGAISASAPIWGFPGMAPCELFYRVVTKDFYKAGGQNCIISIRKSWDIIAEYGQSAEGRQMLTNVFHLCKPLKTVAEAYLVSSWLSAAWTNLAMVDYPYPANFLEPLPGWPIKKVCSHLQHPEETGYQLLESISRAVNVYFNYTGTAKCFHVEQQAVKSLGDSGWDFQACTEQVMPLCADGENDMFPPYKYDFQAFADGCRKKWGITTRHDWVRTFYGGMNISAASNIVFSNGDLDPWSALGVRKSLNPSLVTVLIKDGAHHLDLRSSNPLDPESVINARDIEKQNINKWILQWHKQHG